MTTERDGLSAGTAAESTGGRALVLEDFSHVGPLDTDAVIRACMEMGSPDDPNDMKLTRGVIRAYLGTARTPAPSSARGEGAWSGPPVDSEACSYYANEVTRLTSQLAEARAILKERYVGDDVPKLVGYLMRDHKTLIDDLCRTRGETDANAELKRFVRYIDHEPHLSRGELSRIIDFAQGQKTRAKPPDNLMVSRAFLERIHYRFNQAVVYGRTQNFFAADLAAIRQLLGAQKTEPTP